MLLTNFECIKVNEKTIKDYLNFYHAIKMLMPNPEWLGDFSTIELKNILSSGGEIWMFKQINEIVCSLMFIPAPEIILKKLQLPPGPKYAECGPIMVAPKYVGNGLQRQMLKFLDNYCIDNNFDFILTTIHPANTISINNFCKCGYSYVSSHKLKRGFRALYLKNMIKSKPTKYIFLEGLPKVGKTTILNALKNKHFKDYYFVDEIINKKILNGQSMTEMDFIENEDEKLKLFNKGTVVIDRGPISLLSYSQAKSIICPEYNQTLAIQWFDSVKTILNQNSLVYYIYNDDIAISSDDKRSPYGTEENQRLLKTITEFNIKKYCPNYIFKKYTKENINEVLNEIVD